MVIRAPFWLQNALIIILYDLHFIKWITKLKPYINLIYVHSQFNHNKDARDGVLVKGASSIWPYQSSPPLVHIIPLFHTIDTRPSGTSRTKRRPNR
jgi:hypothetical protein